MADTTDTEAEKVPSRRKPGAVPVTLSVEEAAKYVKRSVPRVYAWLGMRRDDGKPLLPHRRIMGRIIIRLEDIEALPPVPPEATPRSFFAKQKEVTHG